MNEALANLQPTRLWHHFAAISAIPRCSRKEAAVRQYVIDQADLIGLQYRTDATGNVVVLKPASPGYENRPTVVLQGHLDMVCEKNMGVEHNFETDPIVLVRDGDWIHAADTTLGADNGVAVAMMLALLEGDEQAGPLECLFTIDEETGLTGALQLDPSILSGRILINLDSEEEGFFCIGCAGGLNSYISAPVLYEEGADDGGFRGLRIDIRGLRGGHSGAEIHEQRGNALAIGGRLLVLLRAVAPGLRIAAIHGGDKHNAIPRELRVDLRLPVELVESVKNEIARFREIVSAEYRGHEEALEIAVADIGVPDRVLAGSSSDLVGNLLGAIPHGVLGMSREVEGLVETSTNLASIRLEGSELRIVTSQRSSRDSLIDWASGILASIAALAGSGYRAGERYPAWTPDPESTIVATARAVYRDETGEEPEVGAFHAGLECGVIGDKIPGMEMISFGPDLREVHTPDERLSISSTERVYRLLVRILQRIGA